MHEVTMIDFAPSLDLIARLVKQFRTNLAANAAAFIILCRTKKD